MQFKQETLNSLSYLEKPVQKLGLSNKNTNFFCTPEKPITRRSDILNAPLFLIGNLKESQKQTNKIPYIKFNYNKTNDSIFDCEDFSTPISIFKKKAQKIRFIKKNSYCKDYFCLKAFKKILLKFKNYAFFKGYEIPHSVRKIRKEPSKLCKLFDNSKIVFHNNFKKKNENKIKVSNQQVLVDFGFLDSSFQNETLMDQEQAKIPIFAKNLSQVKSQDSNIYNQQIMTQSQTLKVFSKGIKNNLTLSNPCDLSGIKMLKRQNLNTSLAKTRLKNKCSIFEKSSFNKFRNFKN